MFGLLSFGLPRTALVVVAAGFLAIALALGGLYLWSPHATLRITTGPGGGLADRFISALIATTTAQHPRIRFETVEASDLRASAKLLEENKVDIALVRSDVAPPLNGESLVIIRRDVVAIVLPAGSPIKSVAQLSGKKIAIVTNWAQDDNSHALDLILSYYAVPAEAVKREFLPLGQIGAAIREKRIAAVLAVGPVGPGDVVQVVSEISRATKAAPQILALEEGDAIGKRFPGFESIDIPAGAFKARPPTPDDAAKSVAVTYRLAVPMTMLDAVAGVIARAVLKVKAKLMVVTPLANEIEAPDPEEKNPVLPIHPGVSAYLTSGDQSFLDEIQKYLYAVGIPLSLLGSGVAVVTSMMRGKKLQDDQQRVFRLLVIADEATRAELQELETLQREFNENVVHCVSALAQGTSGADQGSLSLAIEHARRAIIDRKAALRAMAKESL